MPISSLSRALATCAALVVLGGTAQARDTIQIAGSSTVLPYASIVAEEFGQLFRHFRMPVVGSGGTGGGLRQFCAGIGPGTIDIANASRPIREGELDTCRANGVDSIVEVRFGFDGIVFASSVGQGDFDLRPEHVFRALAAQVPVGDGLAPNPYTSWAQIDPSLPDQDIVLVIPGTNHGTREVFEEKIVMPGCKAFPAIAEMEKEAREALCFATRQDGRVIDIAGDYTETLARLEAQPQALGVFGLSFYEKNRDRLKVATVEGVAPSLETIVAGDYPVARPLYFYVKGAHLGVVPGLREFVVYFLSDQMAGTDGDLVEEGLIPLPDAIRAQMRARVEAGVGI